MLNQPIKKSNHMETCIFQNTVVYPVVINVCRAASPPGPGRCRTGGRAASAGLCGRAGSLTPNLPPNPRLQVPHQLRFCTDCRGGAAACLRARGGCWAARPARPPVSWDRTHLARLPPAHPVFWDRTHLAWPQGKATSASLSGLPSPSVGQLGLLSPLSFSGGS